jgi:FTR1 family protein
MLASAIILFREALEAALIIGIVLSATRSLPRRGLWVCGGIAAGLLGSFVVALFAQQLSGLAEGTGQELFNALVLLTACVMLGWHNVWMAQHGRELAANSASMGRQVSDGERHMSALAIVVGLAVLREGSEVVLFIGGLLAAGSAANEMLWGSLAGLAAGIFAGGLVYAGLVRIPLKHFFTVTGWIILLLAAGLAAQAAAFLIQAGILPALIEPIWDTSGIISQGNLLGEVLGVMVGYTARPSLMQMLVWALTILVIGGLMWRQRRRERMAAAGALAACVLGLLAPALAPSTAQADHIIYSPIVDFGETEVEFRGHYDFDSDDDKDGAQKYKLDVGHGFTQRWFTELVLEYEKPAQGSGELEALEWENIIQLTEQGEYFADFGLLLEYVYALEDDGHDKIEAGPLMQMDLGRNVWTTNLIFERELGSGAEDEIEWEFASRIMRRISPRFQPAIELYAEEDEMQLGPAILGNVPMGGGPNSFAWEFGALVGLTSDTPDFTLRFLIEAEFY